MIVKYSSGFSPAFRQTMTAFLKCWPLDKARLSAVMAGAGLREVRFRYDFGGIG